MNELEILEEWFKKNGAGLPVLAAAKGFVAMAYDWFDMEAEERGFELLRTAESLYPGYFEGPIHKHIFNDPEFSTIMTRFKLIPLGAKNLRYFGFK